MRHWMGAKRWLAIGAVLVVAGWILGGVAEAAAGESSLAYFRQAKINWRQFEGQKLTIGLNKHQYTESLLPLIGEFEALTGHQGRVPHPAGERVRRQADGGPVAAAGGVHRDHGRGHAKLGVRPARAG